MIRRLFLGLAAAAAFSAAAAVFVFALAFALYAFAEPHTGRAGAAAVVAGVTALLMALTGLLIGSAAQPKKRDTPAAAGGSLLDRAFRFVRDNPVVAVSAALGAGFMAVRNPTYLGSVMRAFMDNGQDPKKRR
jgi:hypothetical protein